jgi:hypothetical protein
MTTKVTENFFEFGNLKYFRGNAHLLELGSFGEKKDPIGAKAYVDPQGRVQRSHLANRASTGRPLHIDLSRVSEKDLGATGSIPVFGLGLKLAASWNHRRSSTAKLKVYSVSLSEGRLTNMLNTDADAARRFLADEGRDGRIVSEVWLVMEAELAEHFESSAAVDLKADGPKLELSAGGGRHGSTTITLSEGSVFAYKLHKVKKWNRGKTAIEDMEADFKGMG